MTLRKFCVRRGANLGMALAATVMLIAGPVTTIGVEAAARPVGPCQFVLGFKALHDQLATMVGDCKQDQHFATNGDAQQDTTGGLMVWRKLDNWTAFTDGFQTWVNGPLGLQQRLNTERFDWEVHGQARASRQFHILSTGLVTKAATSGSLGPLMHIVQTLNNCGPASISEVLNYWGINKSQDELNTILRHGNPWGMSPGGVPGYMQSIGMSAIVGRSGSEGLIKALVANGFPVIVEQFVNMSDHYTHFRPIEGYDDARSSFVASDPLMGQNYKIDYQQFDQIWTATNRLFMVIYPPDKQQLLDDVLNAGNWTG
jgi:uncharacterized protein